MQKHYNAIKTHNRNLMWKISCMKCSETSENSKEKKKNMMLRFYWSNSILYEK